MSAARCPCLQFVRCRLYESRPQSAITFERARWARRLLCSEGGCSVRKSAGNGGLRRVGGGASPHLSAAALRLGSPRRQPQPSDRPRPPGRRAGRTTAGRPSPLARPRPRRLPCPDLWGVVLLTVLLRHPTFDACLGDLRRNAALRRLIGIQRDADVPKKWNLSRFLKVLGRHTAGDSSGLLPRAPGLARPLHVTQQRNRLSQFANVAARNVVSPRFGLWDQRRRRRRCRR
jgi:hypothetical protein